MASSQRARAGKLLKDPEVELSGQGIGANTHVFAVYKPPLACNVTALAMRAALLQTSKLELPAANVRVRFGVRPQSEAAAVMPAQVKARTKTVVGVDGDASVALTCKVTPPFGPELPERLGGVAFLPTARMLMIKFPAKGCPEEVGSKVTVLALAPEKTHAEVEDQMRQLVQQTPMLHPLPVRADAPGKNADCPTLDG